LSCRRPTAYDQIGEFIEQETEIEEGTWEYRAIIMGSSAKSLWLRDLLFKSPNTTALLFFYCYFIYVIRLNAQLCRTHYDAASFFSGSALPSPP